jgi:DHA1 family multidrug resistance protein-like MFS transporter
VLSRGPSKPELVGGWRLSFAALWSCLTVTFLGLSGAMPFMTLYLQDLGASSRTEAAAWAGVINGSSLAIFALMNVIWGAAADRWGLKTGLVRSLGFAAVGLALVGLAQAPEHVLVGRLLHSIGGGPNSAAIAMAGSLVPTSHIGLGMGLLQTGVSLGQSVGPVVGGFVGDAFGFRYAFFGAAALTGMVALLVMLVVREPPRHAASDTGERFFAGVAYVLRENKLRHLVGLLFLFQGGYHALWAFVPLRVQEIALDPSQVGALSGAVLMGDAIGITIGSTLFGWLAPRLGFRRVMASTALVACATTALQAVTWHIVVLVALRLVLGLCTGGLLSTTRGVLALATDRRRRAVTFGVSQGAVAGAASVGSVLGSLAIGGGGLMGAFATSCVLLGLAFVWAARVDAGRLVPAVEPSS